MVENGTELIMRRINIIAAGPYLGLSGDEKGLEGFEDKRISSKRTLLNSHNLFPNYYGPGCGDLPEL
jgi:hypothetical protein